MNSTNLWFRLFFILWWWPQGVWADAGQFQFVTGNVTITDTQGVERFAHKGDAVNEGDVVQSHAAASAQIVFTDKSLVLIRPDSQFKISAYRYEDSSTDNNRSWFDLLRGNIRSITGLIGKANHDRVRIKTTVATIGVRGSDADIGFDPVQQLTGVRTLEGSHYLTAPDSTGQLVTLVTVPGQIALALPGQAPHYSKVFPFVTQMVKSGADPKNAAKHLQRMQQQLEQHKSGFEGQLPPRPDQPAGLEKMEKLEKLNQLLNSTHKPPPVLPSQDDGDIDLKTPSLANSGVGLVMSASAQIGDGVHHANLAVQADNAQQSIVLDRATQAVVAVTDRRPEGDTQFLAGQAQLAVIEDYALRNDQGRVVAAGAWGVWQGDFKIANQQRIQNANGMVHFAVADNHTTAVQLANLGGTQFSYTQVGGSATNETGAFASNLTVQAQGQLSNNANLGQIQVKLGADFAQGSQNWALQGTDSIRSLLQGELALHGSCSSCTQVQGNATGLLIGPQAEGLLLGISASDPQAFLHATTVLQR